MGPPLRPQADTILETVAGALRWRPDEGGRMGPPLRPQADTIAGVSPAHGGVDPTRADA